MSGAPRFLMAGGGTGGHVMPLIAVAQELRRRGHESVFVGTRRGLEAKLVPPAGFAMEWIESQGLKGAGAGQAVRALIRVPGAVAQAGRILGRTRPAAVFSTGGYVAGPVMLAAVLRGTPLALMEPNVMPGLANRWMGRFAARALLNFREAARFFPQGRVELTGVPVRPEFFEIRPKPREERARILITGGSQGSRALNAAMRESWPHFRKARLPVEFHHQSGPAEFAQTEREFAAAGLAGSVVPFIDDMPSALARADLVISRSGAGAVAELAAAGRPAILVPFPFAADQHQLKNAQSFRDAGAARLLPQQELDGARLFREIAALVSEAGELERMGAAARSLARPGAAEKAAQILLELAESEA